MSKKNRSLRKERHARRSQLRFESLENRIVLDAYGAAVLADNPLAFFRFNEGTGTTANDATANSIDGTIENAVYTFNGGGRSAGAGDYALSFDGTGDTVRVVDDSMSINVDAFNPIVTANAVTIEFWQFGGGLQPRADTIFGGYGNSGERRLQSHLPWSNSIVYWDTDSSGGQRLQQTQNDSTKWKGQWNHWTFVKSATTATIYQNGQQFATRSAGTAIMDMESFFIGSAINGSSSYQGLIDDFAVYTSALSASQVAAHYQATFDDAYAANEDSLLTVNSTSGLLSNDFPVFAVENVALSSAGGAATQSSTRVGGGCNVASCAIDGNTNGNFNSNSVTHTNTESMPWWQVQLPASRDIDSIVLFNRTDCCANRLDNFRVSVWQGDPNVGGSVEVFGRDYSISGGVSGSLTVDTPLVKGNYVRVQLADTDPLSLAEVRVFAMKHEVLSVEGNALGGSPTALGDGSVTVATDKGGNVTVNDDGSFSYTPFQSLAAGETDTDTFSYVATNGAGGTLASTVTITLTGENDPPNAMDDGPYMTDEDTALVGVRTNLALAGTATQSSSRIGSGCNDAPCAIDGNTDGNFNNNSVTHTQNQSFTWWQVELPQVSNIDDIVLYNRTDCCGNRLSQFRVSIFDGDPDAGGTETFFFNHPGTAGATVSIDVDAVSPNARGNYVRVAIDPASAAGDAGMNGDGLNSQGGTLSLAEVEVFGTLLHNDTDPDTTDVLSVVAFDATSTNGASVNVSSDGTFDYDPTGSATLQALDEGQALTDTFTYTISDGLTPANGRFIMVQNNGPVNRRLDIGEIEAFAPGVVPAVGNAGGSGSLNPTTDLATAGMGASVHSRGATSSFSKSHGADSELIDGAEETGANTWGASGVGTFVIIDLGQNRDVATVRIHQRNDGCCQDRLMDFTVSLLADSGGSPGAVVQSAVFATQPANNSFGQLIMAEIPSGALDTATVSVQVTGVNDAPVAVADANSVTESADAVVNPQATGNVLTNDADVDDPNSSFTVTAVNGMGGNVGNTVAGTYGSVVISTDGSYTYTLADADPDTQALQEGQVVTETFAYVMNDNHSSGNAMNASSTLTITVTGSNDSPVATDNTAAVQEDTTLTDAGNVISDDDGNGVDSDVDNAMLTVTDIGGTADPNVDVACTYGSLDWDTDGSYTYTLNNAAANVQSLAQGQTVTDTFTYTVNDSAVTPASGRFIRVRNNGPANRLLHIGEIEVFEPGVAPAANFDSANDLALTSKGATVESTVGTGGHGNAQDTIDGLEQSGAAVWTRQAVAAEIVIDLGASFQIERVRVHQRNDSCCQDLLMDFTV